MPAIIVVCTRRLGHKIWESIGYAPPRELPCGGSFVPDPLPLETPHRGSEICRRCNTPADNRMMSFFNRDMLCLECKDDEVGAPNFRLAHLVESGAVIAGNPHFEGIGLADEDIEYLARKRKERNK